MIGNTVNLFCDFTTLLMRKPFPINDNKSYRETLLGPHPGHGFIRQRVTQVRVGVLNKLKEKQFIFEAFETNSNNINPVSQTLHILN